MSIACIAAIVEKVPNCLTREELFIESVKLV